jgi:hypothetical protein
MLRDKDELHVACRTKQAAALFCIGQPVFEQVRLDIFVQLFEVLNPLR